MKKCKSCGAPSRNNPIEGYDGNKNDFDHCWPCARILDMVEVFEATLSRPNLMGHKRTVKLTATITRRKR